MVSEEPHSTTGPGSKVILPVQVTSKPPDMEQKKRSHIQVVTKEGLVCCFNQNQDACNRQDA